MKPNRRGALDTPFSRRTAVTAGAWSVPAIVATVSSPAYAASAVGALSIRAPASVVNGVPATVTLSYVEADMMSGVAIQVTLGGRLAFVGGGGDGVFTTDAAGRIVFDIVGSYSGTIAAAVVGRPHLAAEASVSVTDALVVTDAVSQLVLRVQPPAEEARLLENRQFAHSDLQPTGRYARAGETLQLTTEYGAAELAVGLWGVHAGHNGGVDVGVYVVPGSGEGATVPAPRDGMVFVVHTGAAPQSARVTGGTAVPTFIGGRTSLADFTQQLTRRSGAPFVELIADHMFGDFRYATVAACADRVPQVVADWDTVVAETNRVYGLRSDYGGVAHKHAHRIHIANPDRGVGYASATRFRISFQNDTGAGGDLFRLDRSGLWGLWHEVGHTYQTPLYTWPGLGEVTVNISALAIQEAGGWKSRLDTSGYRAMLTAFRSTPQESRGYDGITDEFLKVLMFDQLRRAFGEDFYPRLSQELRVARATGALLGEPQQAFMRLSSRVAGRDLSRFFGEWGLTADAETAATFARYPKVEAAIWDSVDRTTDPHVDGVVSYSVPTGSLSGATARAVLGLSDVPGLTVTDLRDTLPTRTVVREATPVSVGGSPLVARFAALLRNSAGIPNALLGTAELLRGTSFEFQGISDHVAAWIALDPSTGRLRAGSTGSRSSIHSYFAGEQYFGVTVFSADGGEAACGRANGDENADRFASALEGTRVSVGDIVAVEHREPSRLLRWDEGVPQSASTAISQRYRVESGRLLPL
ncbi:M60 family metallopeptidase [Leifsonia shinshuensis]|uniref:M60 family metallopeptidase n=1 Tax=Leifsonia shinshuensis TaxID=150026 RepID=UPI001F51242E|nr:M60 family metallopeptidase [Leifsonia shinshuensis]MCI0155445.1 M60 family metallopeptidase [Leifsonia shinshuensis]